MCGINNVQDGLKWCEPCFYEGCQGMALQGARRSEKLSFIFQPNREGLNREPLPIPNTSSGCNDGSSLRDPDSDDEAVGGISSVLSFEDGVAVIEAVAPSLERVARTKTAQHSCTSECLSDRLTPDCRSNNSDVCVWSGSLSDLPSPQIRRWRQPSLRQYMDFLLRKL